MQYPYHLPPKLLEVVGYLKVCLEREVKFDCYGLAELSLYDIYVLLVNVLLDKGVEAFDAWNVSRAEQEGTLGF